jgi:arylsulfatase A-like enzyme
MSRRFAWFARSLVVLLLAPLGSCTGTTPIQAPAEADGAIDPSVHADASPGPSPDAAPGPAHANVIFVLTDDLSWNLVRYMPHVLDLQRRGMTFTRYYVTDSLCCPSRSSIFTGKFPHDTGVFTNDAPDGGYAKYESAGNPQTTFATLLAGAGYRTSMSGKFLNGYQPGQHAKDPGWSHWAVAGNGYPEFGYRLNIDGALVDHGSTDADYLTDVLATLGNDFIRGGDAPFFMEIATFAPHAPYTPAPRHAGTFHEQAPRTPAFAARNTDAPRWLAERPALTAAQIAKIDESFNLRVEAVQSVDELIGALEDTLVATGHDRDTYIVFSSDNGYHMGEHGLLAGKQTAFDTDINVPLVVVGPGVPAGATSEAIVENIDLCPTFAAIGGVAAPASVDGRSLLGLWHGEAPADWRDFALVEHRGPDLAPMAADDPDNEPAIAKVPDSYEALRTADATYVEYEDGEREYYDTTTDPWQLTNTAASLPPARAAVLHDALAAAKACHGAAACWAAQKLPH